MRVLVSVCLLGRNCKYSGGNNRNEKVLAFLQGKEVGPGVTRKWNARPSGAPAASREIERAG